MKAIQVKKVGGPEALEFVDTPTPQPLPNEALVKIAAAGVNFIDVYYREGRYKATVPFIAGQEAAGTVSAVGTDVTSVKVGNRVAYTMLLPVLAGMTVSLEYTTRPLLAEARRRGAAAASVMPAATQVFAGGIRRRQGLPNALAQ